MYLWDKKRQGITRNRTHTYIIYIFIIIQVEISRTVYKHTTQQILLLCINRNHSNVVQLPSTCFTLTSTPSTLPLCTLHLRPDKDHTLQAFSHLSSLCSLSRDYEQKINKIKTKYLTVSVSFFLLNISNIEIARKFTMPQLSTYC